MYDISLKLTVSGMVQGVGFRYYTQKKATTLNLSGSVQNLSDGSVLIIAGGAESDINKLITWCKEGGPPAGRVDNVIKEVIIKSKENEFNGFSIIR